MKVELNNVDYSTNYTPDELDAITWTFMAEDADYGTGSMPVPDPTGTLELYAGMRCKLTDTGSGIVVFNGFLGGIDTERGAAAAGNRIVPTYSLVDANAYLHGTREFNWRRPAETDCKRLLAYKAIRMPTFDTTWVLNSHNKTLKKETYNSEDWVSDFLGEAQDLTGKTLFVIRNNTSGDLELHWHQESQGDTAGLEINDTTFDYVLVFPPDKPQRSKDPTELDNDLLAYSGTKFARVTDTTSLARHNVGGLRHTRLQEMSGLSVSAMRDKAEGIVAAKRFERVTYECDIGPLTAAQLNMLLPGSLIRVTSKVMHLSGSTQRIAAMKVTYRHPGVYFAHLQMGFSLRTHQSASTLPPKPVTRPELPPFQQVCDAPFTTATLHVVDGVATDSVPVLAGQYVYVLAITNAITWLGTSPADMIFSSEIDFFGTRIVSFVSPWPTTSLPGTWTSPDVAPPDPSWSITDQASEGDWIDATWVASGVYRGAHPVQTSGNLSVGITLFGVPYTGYNGTVLVAVSDLDPLSFDASAPSSCTVPLQGQPVPLEVVGVGDDVRTDWQLRFDYAPSSLQVGIRPPDGAGGFGAIQWIQATETDPATGQFTTFPIPLGWQVVAQYQGGDQEFESFLTNPPPDSSTTARLRADSVVGSGPLTAGDASDYSASSGSHGPHYDEDAINALIAAAAGPAATQFWRIVTVFDGTNWLPLVDGSGNAIYVFA